jgi:drug/metabolite transporter (DMT)-like permease
LSLSAGTGALILFGAVQATMILAVLVRGERPRRVEWLGLSAALGGLVYLVAPGLAAPPPLGSALMAVAGVAWGLYSLRGAGGGDPLVVTRDNFLRALPWALGLSLVAAPRFDLSWPGVLWAVLSGAITSGAGYAVWYAALRGLTSTRAAIVQLAVPVLAAGGGVLLLDERLSWRLVLSAVLILGGVGLSLTGRRRR